MNDAPSRTSAQRVAIAVFSRAPIPGEAKTRLIPLLGPEAAADLQSLLIARAVGTAVAAEVGPVTLWCAPHCEHAVFATTRDAFHVELVAQRGTDLGARMFDAFEQLCRRGPTLIIGTDCPALTSADLRAAAEALTQSDDAVLKPAEDGGYVLIGLRYPVRSLFHAIPWGDDSVMTITRERLRGAGLRWRELSTSWDVDRPADLERLDASGLLENRRQSLVAATHGKESRIVPRSASSWPNRQ